MIQNLDLKDAIALLGPPSNFHDNPPGVLVICGGGGKTTLSNLHKELFIDIDEYWNKDTGPAEALLIQIFEIEKNVPDRFNSLIDACVFLKAENCVRAGTQGRIPLVQIPGQAQWIVDRISSSLSSPSERLMYKVLVLVPSLALHEQNLNAKNESDWVKDICRDQRKMCESFPTAEYYGSHGELVIRAIQFAQSCGLSIKL